MIIISRATIDTNAQTDSLLLLLMLRWFMNTFLVPSERTTRSFFVGTKCRCIYFSFHFYYFQRRNDTANQAPALVAVCPILTSLRAWLRHHCSRPLSIKFNASTKIFFLFLARRHSFFIIKLMMVAHTEQVIRRCCQWSATVWFLCNLFSSYSSSSVYQMWSLSYLVLAVDAAVLAPECKN